MRLIALAVLAGFSILVASPSMASSCDESDALVVDLAIGTDVVRREAPATLFGFNIPWRDFQLAFVRQGALRPELVDWLKPFAGASYRYPGGTPSNWFDWAASEGPVDSRRPVHADYGRYAPVLFGVAEFASFLDRVDGRAVLTANLFGPYREKHDEAALRSDGAAFAEMVQRYPALRCVAGPRCRLIGIELGNEVDIPPHRLQVDEYVRRAKIFRAGVLEGAAMDLAFIANGRSAPWEPYARDYNEFNRTLAHEMGGEIAGLAVHPYYDGINVAAALRYVSEFGRASGSAGRVYVTEHARWPAVPARGDWRQNWYQTTSLGGAIATADFILGLIPDPTVEVANWHALAGIGPWQLFAWDQPTDSLTPSALYWGLRVLRAGYLQDVLAAEYVPTRVSGYGGNYDQRLVVMVARDRSTATILGVNRAPRPVRLRARWATTLRMQASYLETVSGLSADVHNSAADPQRVVARRISLQTDALGICIAANAVFAVHHARR